MRVSVVVITRDRPELLAEALASVLAQSSPPVEVVVVDDGSRVPVTLPSDDGSGISMRLLRREGGGPSAARNAGAAAAKGEVLAFLDDDDLWDSDYLESVGVRIEESEVEMVVTWMDNILEGVRSPGKHLVPERIRTRTIYASNPGVTGSNLAITKAAFERLGGFDPDLIISEDKDFLARALNNGIKPVIVELPKVLHRVHSSFRLSDDVRSHPQKVASKEIFLKKHQDMPSSDKGYLSLELGLSFLRGVAGAGRVLFGIRLLILGVCHSCFALFGGPADSPVNRRGRE